jgi:hypothetical protein
MLVLTWLARGSRCFEQLCGGDAGVKAISRLGILPKLDWQLALRFRKHTGRHHHDRHAP